MGIWARVQAVNDLIPFLNALFENLNYLKVHFRRHMSVKGPDVASHILSNMGNAIR